MTFDVNRRERRSLPTQVSVPIFAKFAVIAVDADMMNSYAVTGLEFETSVGALSLMATVANVREFLARGQRPQTAASNSAIAESLMEERAAIPREAVTAAVNGARGDKERAGSSDIPRRAHDASRAATSVSKLAVTEATPGPGAIFGAATVTPSQVCPPRDSVIGNSEASNSQRAQRKTPVSSSTVAGFPQLSQSERVSRDLMRFPFQEKAFE
jgi:hypothetical protein